MSSVLAVLNIIQVLHNVDLVDLPSECCGSLVNFTSSMLNLYLASLSCICEFVYLIASCFRPQIESLKRFNINTNQVYCGCQLDLKRKRFNSVSIKLL